MKEVQKIIERLLPYAMDAQHRAGEQVSRSQNADQADLNREILKSISNDILAAAYLIEQMPIQVVISTKEGLINLVESDSPDVSVEQRDYDIAEDHMPAWRDAEGVEYAKLPHTVNVEVLED